MLIEGRYYYNTYIEALDFFCKESLFVEHKPTHVQSTYIVLHIQYTEALVSPHPCARVSKSNRIESKFCAKLEKNMQQVCQVIVPYDIIEVPSLMTS